MHSFHYQARQKKTDRVFRRALGGQEKKDILIYVLSEIALISLLGTCLVSAFVRLALIMLLRAANHD